MVSYSQDGAKISIPVNELFWSCLLSIWPISDSLLLIYPRTSHYAVCTCYYPCWASQTFHVFLDWHLSLIVIISRPGVLVHWLGRGDLSQKFRLLCWDAVTCFAAARFCGCCHAVWNVSLSPKPRQPWRLSVCQDFLRGIDCLCTANSSVLAFGLVFHPDESF